MNSVSCFLFLFLGYQLTELAKSDFPTEEFQANFSKASCTFALDLIKTSSKESNENLILSPSSVSVLLAILQQGAEGNTAAQLEKVLYLSAENSKAGYGHVIRSLQREMTNLTLEWGNRAFVIPGFELKDTYLNEVEENFNSTFDKVDFNCASDAASKINDWVKEVTHNNIHDLVDASLLNPDVVMVMVNAIYFKSVWASPFQKFKTRNDKFQINQDNKIEVPFMRQAGRFSAGEDAELGIKWVELFFLDDNFSMIFVLPIKVNGLSQVIEKMSGEDLRRIIINNGTRQVKLIIPKFKLNKKILLAETLKELGLTDIFTNDSNLNGISEGEKKLQLSQLIHEANVEIDEDGSIAAAASFEIVQTLSFEWFTDELYFRADHPFLFFLVDKLNQVPIFAGQVINPKDSTLKSNSSNVVE